MANETPTNDSHNGGVVSSEDLHNDPEYRALMEQYRALEDSTILLARASWARSMGITFDGKRDMYGVLGYKDTITASDYRTLYERGGIAGQVLDAPVDATWRSTMELIEDETKDKYTEFEQAWIDFEQNLEVREVLRRADKVAGLSTYGVLLLGDGSSDFEKPLKKVQPSKDSYKGIIYLTPFLGGGSVASTAPSSQKTQAGDADATVAEYDVDVASPRFGKPLSYRLKRVDIANALPRPVHWTRIIHIAEGLLDDDVFGLPAFERVHNLFDDLLKVTGGGAEAFWLRANQGLHANIDKDMDLSDPDGALAKLKEDMEAYQHNLTRWIRSRGVDVQTLGSDVANFGPPADAILTQISGAKGIPKRILTGSEMGELASSQDRDNWKDKVVGRQTLYAGPKIVKQLANRMIEFGYLPTPVKGPKSYEVVWSPIETLTEGEKATGALQWSQTKDGEEPVFTDAEIRDHWYGMSPLSDQQRKERADRKLENQKNQLQMQQQMAPPQPEPKPQDRFKAAEEAELVVRLADALEAGDADYIKTFLGLGEGEGHPFRGNQYTGGEATAGHQYENVKEGTFHGYQINGGGMILNVPHPGGFTTHVYSKQDGHYHNTISHTVDTTKGYPILSQDRLGTGKVDQKLHERLTKLENALGGLGKEKSGERKVLDTFLKIQKTPLKALGDVAGHEFHGNQWTEGKSSEASHPTHPLPDKHPGEHGGYAVYSLPDQKEGALDTMINKEKDGTYYGQSDKFDFTAKNAKEMRAKLQKMGASYMGWERKLSALGDVPGHEFHGNQYEVHGQSPSQTHTEHVSSHTSLARAKKAAQAHANAVGRAVVVHKGNVVSEHFADVTGYLRGAGDAAGHPFYGNQWTEGGGGYSGKLADPKTALDTMAAHTNASGSWSEERQKLHAEILNPKIDKVPPVKDRKPVIHLTGGGPASGKSAMLKTGKFTVPSKEDAVHVDPDALKKALPEYRAGVAAGDPDVARFTHEESSYLSKQLAQRAVRENRDVVLDGTGDNDYASLKSKIEKIKGDSGAKIIANYATNDVEQALASNIHRAADPHSDSYGRLVPESVLRSTHANVSKVLPMAIKDGLFDHVTLWDTNIKGAPRKVASAEGKTLVIHDKQLWSDFLAKGKAQ